MTNKRVWNTALALLSGASLLPLFGQVSVADVPQLWSYQSKQQETIAQAWVPISRIDPAQPATVTVFNDTSLTLEYGFSSNRTPPKELASGETVTLEIASLPSTLLINAVNSMAVLDYAFDPASPEVATDNAVTVTVSLIDRQYDAVGFNAIDFHQTGAIYRY